MKRLLIYVSDGLRQRHIEIKLPVLCWWRNINNINQTDQRRSFYEQVTGCGRWTEIWQDMDERGQEIWSEMMDLLDQIDG